MEVSNKLSAHLLPVELLRISNDPFDEPYLILGPQSISKLRSIYYPPITKAIEERMALEKSQIVRCGEHSDYGTITFLYQDDMGGLEVRAVDNSWIKARISIEMDRALHLISFFEHPYGVSSIRAHVQPAT